MERGVQLHACLMLHALKRISQLQSPGQSVPELPDSTPCPQKPSGVQLPSCRLTNTLQDLSQETPPDILVVFKELWEDQVSRLCLGAVGCAARGDGVPGAMDQPLPLACRAGHEPGGGGGLCLSLAMGDCAVGSPVQAQKGQCSTALLFCFVA